MPALRAVDDHRAEQDVFHELAFRLRGHPQRGVAAHPQAIDDTRPGIGREGSDKDRTDGGAVARALGTEVHGEDPTGLPTREWMSVLHLGTTSAREP